MVAAYARHCPRTEAQGANQDQATVQPSLNRNCDQNMKTTVQIIQFSKGHSAVHKYLTVTNITDMCLNLSETERLGLGNFEAFLGLKSSILFIRQQ